MYLAELDDRSPTSNVDWRRVSRSMRFLRTILALLIAWPLVALPASGATFAMAGAIQDILGVAETEAMPADMSAGMNACCPGEEKTLPCDRSAGQCPMAFCAGQPVTIGAVFSLHLNIPMPRGDRLPIPLDQVVSLDSGNPPFRPPRI